MTQTRRQLSFFVAGLATILAPIGLAMLAFFLLIWSVERLFQSSGGETIDILQSVSSPDQINVASTYRSMGGGAAGWCSTSVNVRSAWEEMKTKDYVFSSHCGTRVDLAWKDSGILRISYLPEEENFGITQKMWNNKKTVRILYAEK